jgi:hypothetical protein
MDPITNVTTNVTVPTQTPVEIPIEAKKKLFGFYKYIYETVNDCWSLA